MKKLSFNARWKRYVLITVSFLLTFVLITGACISFFHAIRNYEMQHTLEHLEETSLYTAETMKDNLNASLDLINNVAELLVQFPDMHSEGVMSALNHVVEHSNFARIGITDTAGVSFITTGEVVDVSSRDFFKQTIAGRSCISEVLNSNLRENKVFMVSSPLYSQEDIIGVLYGVYDVEQFSDLVNFSTADSAQYNYIIDGNGSFILRSSHPNSLMKEASSFWDFLSQVPISDGLTVEGLQKRFAIGESGMVEYGERDEARIAYYTPLGINDWYVISATPRSSLFQSVTDISLISMGFTAQVMVFFLLLVLVIFYLGRRVRREIFQGHQNLAISEETFRIALNQTRLTVFDYDIRTKVLTLKNGEHLDRTLPREIPNVPESLVENGTIEAESAPAFYKLYDQVIAGAKSASAIVQAVHNKVSYWEHVTLTNIFDSRGKVIRTIGIIEDITDQKQKENALRYHAQRDPLTKLYNRTTVEELVEEFLKTPGAEVGIHAFAYIDLDNFKQINDTLGHTVGDQVLQDVAYKLQKRFRQSDLLARMGGDEFVVFMKNFPDKEALERNITAFMPQLTATYTKEDGSCPVTVSASMGIAIAPVDGESFGELYRKADVALYRVKNATKNGFTCYEESFEEKSGQE